MSSHIYGKLAFTNLKNNRKTYLPYMIAAILSTAMFYMLNALGLSDSLKNEMVRLILSYGSVVLALFLVIFLFYTNSFLIKRRKQEIGVYNILGMGKGHIAKMMIMETLMTAMVSIAAGLVLGVIFSKLMYMIVLKILHYDVSMNFGVSILAVVRSVMLLAAVFAATLIYNLLQVSVSRPVELLSGSSKGEREPKTRWILAILGLAFLAVGYYLANTVETPLAALFTFLKAVVLVVLGTYAFFIAGTIAILKLLKKKKSFYYKPNHFTAVSGMLYRMKQNAVGLANICILSTMVLVSVSTTVCIYTGMEDELDTRFAREMTITYATEDEAEQNRIQEIIKQEMKGVPITNQIASHQFLLDGIREGNQFTIIDGMDYTNPNYYEIVLIPLEDYNQMEDRHVTLEPDQVLCYTNVKKNYGGDSIALENQTFRVKEELKDFCVEEKRTNRSDQILYVICPDMDTLHRLVEKFGDRSYEERFVTYEAAFDIDGNVSEWVDAEKKLVERIREEFPNALTMVRELSKTDFFELYGSLFFIGIYLGAMFLMMTVLIIYYKQISEGYDDRERFKIMQQVGMDQKEVKSSIRSQVLLVFFLPLGMAFLHVAAAHQVISKLLVVLNMNNQALITGCIVGTAVVFGLFYILVFVLTEREYYRLVRIEN